MSLVPRPLPERTTILEREAVDLLTAVDVLAVTSNKTYLIAVGYAKKGRLLVKALKEIYDPNVRAWDQGHSDAVARRAQALATPARLVAIADEKALTWNREQERRRHEANAAARLEQERLETEARQRALDEEARLRQTLEDTQLAAAVEAERHGDHERAARILETPVAVAPVTPEPVFVPPPAMPETPKTPGYGFRTTYQAVLTNLGLIVEAAARGNTAALACLAFNQTTANGLARSFRGGPSPVPGVDFRPVTSATGRLR